MSGLIVVVVGVVEILDPCTSFERVRACEARTTLKPTEVRKDMSVATLFPTVHTYNLTACGE